MSHISYSALKNWDFCPFYHKLTYLDKVNLFLGNVYTAFGTALHETCEKLTEDKSANYENIFKFSFENELSKLADIPSEHQKLITEMRVQGITLAKLVIQSLDEMFPGWQLVSCEEKLMEPIHNEISEYDFKGFIDLVLKTPNGKYHIIDWKSCSWGWDMKKKTDKMLAYQLSFYKNYFAKKHNIDLKNIETYFILLKRTAKKDRVEVLRVTNAERRIKNSLTLLETAVKNINSNRYIKNKTACSRCHLYKVHCNG